MVLNAFTVDLEDWYQGLEIDCDKWEGYEDRLEIGTRRLLALLDEAGVRATFFVLGYAAERATGLIREIASGGHEIASHGYGHHFIYKLTPDQFREDLQRSIAILEPLADRPVVGHRAPYFSITPKSEWALDVLCECGVHFDSSLFPVVNYRYGFPDAPREIHPVRPGLVEFPLSTFRLGGRNIPIAGGAYFRLFPYTFTKYGLRRINRSGQAAVFYIHPWELDPDHPRLNLAARIRVPHYRGLSQTVPRLRNLLRDFRFGTVGQVLGATDIRNSPQRPQKAV